MGRQEDSFEAQLASQVKSQIRFHSELSYEQLTDRHTHVVVATGDGEYARRMHSYRVDLTVAIKGATVEGSFERSTVRAWLNYELAPYGYGYLIPYSEKEANIVVAIQEPLNPGIDLRVLGREAIPFQTY